MFDKELAVFFFVGKDFMSEEPFHHGVGGLLNIFFPGTVE